MPFPFSNLPLSVSPYYSRVSDLTANTATPYNYPLIAFTPGYALRNEGGNKWKRWSNL